MKKAQAGAATVILLVFVMILVAILIILILIYGFPQFLYNDAGISGKTAGYSDNYNTKPDYTLKIVDDCPPPYIRVGGNCCLDRNYNGVCDNDEAEKVSDVSVECSYPYIKRDGRCCLDDDRNGICDIYDRNDYRDDYRDIKEDGYLRFPFSMTDVDFFRDEIVIEIKNRDDEDYTIKSIDISGCDEEDLDTLIPEDKRKEFSIDCEDARDRRSRNVEVVYEDSEGKEDSVEGRVSYD